MPHVSRVRRFSPSDEERRRLRQPHYESQNTTYHYSYVPKPNPAAPITPVEPQIPDFRFRVDLEFLARSRVLDHKQQDTLEQEVSSILSTAGVPNRIASQPPSSDTESNNLWTVVSDASLKPSSWLDYEDDEDQVNHSPRLGLRLISPLERFSQFGTWDQRIRDTIAVLNANFEITTTHQCGTHVSIVPINGQENVGWHLWQIKALAKSVLYFEHCLDAVVPVYRRSKRCIWAKSNRQNELFGSMSTEDCFAKIRRQGSAKRVAMLMNRQFPAQYGPSHSRSSSSTSSSSSSSSSSRRSSNRHQSVKTTQTDSTFKWDFLGLLTPGTETVAFRQPPGCTTASQVISWVSLVVVFAQLACCHGRSLMPQYRADLGSLSDWMLYQAGCSRVPLALQHQLKVLFDDSSKDKATGPASTAAAVSPRRSASSPPASAAAIVAGWFKHVIRGGGGGINGGNQGSSQRSDRQSRRNHRNG